MEHGETTSRRGKLFPYARFLLRRQFGKSLLRLDQRWTAYANILAIEPRVETESPAHHTLRYRVSVRKNSLSVSSSMSNILRHSVCGITAARICFGYRIDFGDITWSTAPIMMVCVLESGLGILAGCLALMMPCFAAASGTIRSSFSLHHSKSSSLTKTEGLVQNLNEVMSHKSSISASSGYLFAGKLENGEATVISETEEKEKQSGN